MVVKHLPDARLAKQLEVVIELDLLLIFNAYRKPSTVTTHNAVKGGARAGTQRRIANAMNSPSRILNRPLISPS